MLDGEKFKIYIAIIGLILIICSILLALIYAFTFDSNKLYGLLNGIYAFFSNAFFYIGILLLIISGFLFFKDRYL